MSVNIIPKNFLSFPNLDLFKDNDDWLLPSNNHSGLAVSEDEKHIIIEASLPGIEADNIDITYQDGYVWIQGQQKREEKDTKRKYYQKASESFSYRIALPGEIDHQAEPQADLKNGVMTITFSKSPASQPKKIKIAVKQK